MRIFRKLTSRKFIMALAAAISGIVTAFVGKGEAVNVIVGSAMTVLATVVYCVMEGVVDTRSVGRITDAAVDIAETLRANKDAVDAIEKVGNAAAVFVGEDGE